jgi:dTDP-4-amino-4,6-dideoxygalactose transaminase
MQVPYLDLAAAHTAMENELLQAAQRVLRHGQFILGPEVVAFEQRFAELCGTKYAVSVNSGTDALLLAFKVLGVGPGDEVITAPNSFVATASAIVLAGAQPVFVDVGANYNIDPALIERAITPRTKAIVPVHLTGRPANMAAISEIAGRHRLPVVEDAAQAVMAEFGGQRVGSFGALGCFSMHPLKNLSACGDAGAIATDDASLYRQLLSMRNIGLETREKAVSWSGNSRLDTLQAALLLVKLDHLEKWTERRREHAAFYFRQLAEMPEVQLPPRDPRENSVYHTFVIQVSRRDELTSFLQAKGVGTAIHYPIPIHLQPAAAPLGYAPGSFPVAERQAERILSLPVFPDLQPDQRSYVVECIRQFYHPS